MTEIIMPDLSTLDFQMEAATIVRWLKKEGDRVEKGKPLFEVMTEKVTIEIESTASGTLRRILAQEGEEVPVAKVIAIIE